MYSDSIQNTSFHGLATHKQNIGPSHHNSANQNVGYQSQQKEWFHLQTRTNQLPEREHNREIVALSLKEDESEQRKEKRQAQGTEGWKIEGRS
jgi:hypothetical protein